MGQKAEASLGIMDSQSVLWGDNRSLNGIDGNKKVKGVKSHVVVDKKAAYLLVRCLRELCCNIKVVLADAGYRGEVTDKIKRAFGYILQASSGMEPYGQT